MRDESSRGMLSGLRFQRVTIRHELWSQAKRRSVFPAATGAPQETTVLGHEATVRPMRRNHFNVVPVAQVRIEWGAVVPAIADQAGREPVDKPRPVTQTKDRFEDLPLGVGEVHASDV